MILSVSQVETFDHAQKGGCERKFWFERVQFLKPDQVTSQSEGEKGHELLAEYMLTGEPPAGRVKMGKHVRGLILKGEIPAPGNDLAIEQRFSGQQKTQWVRGCEGSGCGHPCDTCGGEYGNHARTDQFAGERGESLCRGKMRCVCVAPPARREWIPLDVSKTLHLAGVPWEGFIDLSFVRDLPTVLDWKFSSDIHAYAKKPGGLIKTVQMPTYVLALMNRDPRWASADRFELRHHYIARSGIDSFPVSEVVTRDQVLERKSEIEALAERVKLTFNVPSQDDVPFNRRSCETWLGCPHQSICKAFKENKTMLTPEEQAMFADVPPLDDPAPAPAAAVVVDPVAAQRAKLQAELAALDAAPAAPAKVRRLAIQDVPANPIPDSAPAAPVPPPRVEAPKCGACAAPLSPENASKLASGLWKHIGCPKDAPAPVNPAAIVAPDDAPKSASEPPPAPAEPKKRGRPPGSTNAPAAAAPVVLASMPAPSKLEEVATVAHVAGGAVEITIRFDSIASAAAFLSR